MSSIFHAATAVSTATRLHPSPELLASPLMRSAARNHAVTAVSTVAPPQASPELLASPLMRSAARLQQHHEGGAAAFTPALALPLIDNLEQVIDLSLRLGWSRRQLEIDKIGAVAALALAERRISEIEYTALNAAQARRRADIRHRGQLHTLRYGAPKRPRYDQGVARRGRTQLVMMGMLPPHVAAVLTPAQIASATVVGTDYIEKGFTDDAKAYIANRARCCERVVQRMQATLLEQGMIRVTQRTLSGRRGYTTIIEIIDPMWLFWLKNRRVSKPRREKGDRPVCEHIHTDLNKHIEPAETPKKGSAGKKIASPVPKSGSS
jgi:hypothetical protein